MMHPTTHGIERRGFALPITLLAMIVIGAIVTGGFYASNQETRLSSSADLGSQAFYIAEYGIEDAMGSWNNRMLDPILSGTVEDMGEGSVDLGGRTLGTYTLTARRLGVQLFLVTSTGEVTAGSRQARRSVAVLVRTAQVMMPASSALMIYGGLTAGGNSQIDGSDVGNDPPYCEAGDQVAGVTAYDTTLISEGNRERIIGSPQIAENTELDTTGLSRFGDLPLADLIAAATRSYAPGESVTGMGPVLNADGTCDTTVRNNWGDARVPLGPCNGHLPIIYAQGDLHLKTGTGQGILIVNGNLKASGNFDFYGVVIVLGELETTGTGNHLQGSVIVQGHGNLDSESTTLGNSLVQYSKCSIRRAFSSALRPRPLANRAWLDFSAAARATL